MVFWCRRQRSMSTSASRKIPMISSVDLLSGTDLQARAGSERHFGRCQGLAIDTNLNCDTVVIWRMSIKSGLTTR
jgi:hypothetical protein